MGIFSNQNGLVFKEKRKRLGQPRQAQDEPAERLLYNLLDGLN